MEVDEHGTARRLRETVRHRDGGGLLERQDVLEVGREVLQERLLRRAEIAEDCGHGICTEQVVGSVFLARNLARTCYLTKSVSGEDRDIALASRRLVSDE